MSLNILIYDDETEEAGKIVKRLEALKIPDATITRLSKTEFELQLKTLSNRIDDVRNEKTFYLNEDGSNTKTFDSADILIVDYDLFNANDLLTGEIVAYNARCFSDCGLIIAINQFGDTDFDLTLRGHPESYADINISIANIDNPNLWGKYKAGFHPWYWPSLPSFVEDFESKVADVENAIDKGHTVCQMLDIPDQVFASLPRSVAQFVGSAAHEVKVSEFIEKSGNCFRHGDIKAATYKVLASRVGAARIGKWIETTLLPGQDFLIDAPHLVLRYPSVLGGAGKLKDWNATARLSNQDDCKILSSEIEKHRLKKRHWASRPVWIRTRVSEDDKIDEVREPWSAKYSQYCFCEDVSEFDEPKYCTEFVADTESQFARRYVKRLGPIKYRPEIRFAM
jgi:hypothetical protein